MTAPADSARALLADVLLPLRDTLKLAAHNWYRLLAWFLVAYLLRRGALDIAAHVGVHAHLPGLLLLPTAVLASLGTYVVMFLLLRRQLPNHQRAVRQGDLAGDSGLPPGTDRHFLDAVVLALLPFLAFYATWKFLRTDALDYANRGLDLANQTDFNFLTGKNSLPGDITSGLTGPRVIAVAVGVYVLRLVIKRLPEAQSGGRWLSIGRALVTGYLECLWLFLAAYGVIGAVVPSQWLAKRQVVADLKSWWHSLLNGVFGSDGSVRDHADSVLNALNTAVTAVWNSGVEPLMWLTIVAVILGRALPNPAPLAMPDRPGVRRVRSSTDRAPTAVVYAARAVSADWRSRWSPVVDAFRLVTRAGLLPFCGFLVCYELIDVSYNWVWMAFRTAFGAHPVGWWMVADDPIDAVASAVQTILRVCLLAAAYDRIVAALAGYRDEPVTASAAGNADSASAGSPPPLPYSPPPLVPGTGT